MTAPPPPPLSEGLDPPLRVSLILQWVSDFPLVCYTAVFSVVMQRSSPGGALRDDTKNGCVAD